GEGVAVGLVVDGDAAAGLAEVEGFGQLFAEGGEVFDGGGAAVDADAHGGRMARAGEQVNAQGGAGVGGGGAVGMFDYFVHVRLGVWVVVAAGGCRPAAEAAAGGGHGI